MSGTDPDPRRNQIDRTQAYRPADATPAPAPDPNLPKIPGITLHFELARGGMGVVYSGRQDFLDRRVAVKLLSVELGGESFVQRFQREAKILAGIKHPNIVACHMAGQTDEGQSYLVMEFIDGPSLKKWITDNGPVPVKAALRTARAVAQALGHGHTLGIIHRDVKPENILLETVTSTALDVTFPFTPKVVDLGLARASEGNASMGLTSPGSVMGTPATMSPEQYDEPDLVDFRTDIYGLGCALYEMLTAQPAFRGKKLSEIVARKREPLAPDPCTENPEVPSAVGALVQSMLAPERTDRPASYKELDEMLAALIDAMSTQSSRITKPQAFVGEETVTGPFRPTRPGSGPADNPTIARGGTQKPGAKPNDDSALDRTVPSKGKPEAKPAEKKPPEKKSGPGLLVTGEINFLAEGLGKPMGEDGGDSPFRTKPPADGGAPPKPQVDVWATKPPTGGSTQPTPAEPPTGGTTPATPSSPTQVPVAAGGRKTGMYIAAAALVIVGIGGWIAFGGGAGPKPDPKPDPDKPITSDPDANKPKPGNRAPVVAAIEGPTEVAWKRDFQLEVKAQDPDGDGLHYAWSMPDEIREVSGRGTSKPTFRVEEGLPQASFAIVVEVTDDKNATVKQTHSVTLGDMPFDSFPLRDIKNNPNWRLDTPPGIGWVPSIEGFLALQAKESRYTGHTSLGTDTYWEWMGSLTSGVGEGDAKGSISPPALLGFRFELGDHAWSVACTRTGKDDAAAWRMEIAQWVPKDGDWVPEKFLEQYEWTPPDDQDDHRGWFSVQRRGKELVIEIGEAVQPVGSRDEQHTSKKQITLPLGAFAGEATLTLFIDKGYGRFRARRR